MSRKHPTSPDLSGVPNAPGSEHYPPITAANCADLAFARKLVRQMRSDKGGRLHRRALLRRASSRIRESESERHLYHGTYTDAEQRKRDLFAPDGLPPRSGLPGPPVACDFDRLSFDEHLDEQPPYPWLDQFVADENAEFIARSRAQRSGWWCDWVTAFDRRWADYHRPLITRPRNRTHARSARRPRPLTEPDPLARRLVSLIYGPQPVPPEPPPAPTHIDGHPIRPRWQDCAPGDAVHARNFPITIDDPLVNHPLILHWPVRNLDTSRTFARSCHDLWVRTA